MLPTTTKYTKTIMNKPKYNLDDEIWVICSLTRRPAETKVRGIRNHSPRGYMFTSSGVNLLTEELQYLVRTGYSYGEGDWVAEDKIFSSKAALIQSFTEELKPTPTHCICGSGKAFDELCSNPNCVYSKDKNTLL